MKTIIVSILTLVLVQTQAQKVSNIKAELLGEEVNIYYDLDCEDANKVFEISIYCDANNYTEPLKYVRGAVGVGVKSGKQNKIIWEFKKDGFNPMAQLNYKVKVKTAEEGITAKSTQLKINESYKRGSKIKFSLNNKEIIAKPSFKLYQKNVLVANLEYKLKKKNEYIIYLPEHTRPGLNYRIKALSTKYKEIYLWSNEFSVKE